MSLRLEIELDKLDPAVPFRASRNHLHHTWARTFYTSPELYIQPESLEEVLKVVTLARRCRRRVVVVGCAHSPSDLTCSSSWIVNLDKYNNVLRVDKDAKTMTVQGGMRLADFNRRAAEHGLTIRNLGSIDEQSIVGAIATATHGSSLQHGLLSQNVKSLRIVLANGGSVKCSKDHNEELFRAALVSLGALGIIVEVEFQLRQTTNIEWVQSIEPLSLVTGTWNTDLWTQAEFTRVWWLPYLKRAIIWRADTTTKPRRAPASNWYGGSMGYHIYHNLLWLSNYFPRLLPAIEWFVFGMQYGFRNGTTASAVEEMRSGLLMNCLYSQFVNEWAIPLSKGLEAIDRLSAWLNGDEVTAAIPFSSEGLWVHSPIEVRVSDTSSVSPRPFLDPSCSSEPTLYLNATLYRPYHQDPPCRERYYEAFEYLMRSLGGRPHWAKNFNTVTQTDIQRMYGADLNSYLKIRQEVDPEGMFVGAWHRRLLLGSQETLLARNALSLEEREVARESRRGGGMKWYGEVVGGSESVLGSATSEESFDLMQGAEAEQSMLMSKSAFVLEEVDGDEQDHEKAD
ncbi:D-arabinono-1,4-lactone oxidase [Pseudovirgaria hyperparasitica]|uniref:D-arabinono-1,4-lactone oxidase n=1 Tax=Pseudovirgaria hyperparasitica TaxID=470096 RepID=A0A6A6W2P2_9PEZI|nr:D-arabinono-1,4-lactone oxidase [Pseudovirgaria hyperparasitica]KAF2756825.1 D-arabinono-1,4-lactone oxidase [Pseudovirgaria hyperparasitica]